MPSAILPTTLAIPRPPTAANPTLSSIRFLSGAHQFPLLHPLPAGDRRRSSRELVIRMGGGPRTFPGGVSKWQWKRMQAKKSKQLLKARLCRERQLYEMRKRAELRAAAAELERPWEVVERAPKLFSVGADEQLKALADRFQRPGGFDMWNDRDGPQVFRSPADGLPSARFFPKGVVHSVRPYGVAQGSGEDGEEDAEELRFDDWIARGAGGVSRRRRRSRRSLNSGETHGSEEDAIDVEAKNLDEGTDQSDQNLTFTSKNSRSLRNFNRQASGAGKDWRASVQDGVAMDSCREMVATDNGHINRSRNRSNSQRQNFRGRFGSNELDETMGNFNRSRNRSNSQRQNFRGPFGSNELDETMGNFKDLKVGDGEPNSVKLNVSPRNHWNYRSQGSGAQVSSNGVKTMASGKVEVSKMGGNKRYSSGSSRSKMERITLRPTSDLFNKEGSYEKKNGIQKLQS